MNQHALVPYTLTIIMPHFPSQKGIETTYSYNLQFYLTCRHEHVYTNCLWHQHFTRYCGVWWDLTIIICFVQL